MLGRGLDATMMRSPRGPCLSHHAAREHSADVEPLMTFTVAATMPVTQISTLIYGSTDRAMKILQLNPIENAFEVTGGMRLRVYRPETEWPRSRSTEPGRGLTPDSDGRKR
jgi:hypothetical protein